MQAFAPMGDHGSDEGSDEGSIDEKLAPHAFVTDFVWAARAVVRQPSVALASMTLWVLPTIWTLGPRQGAPSLRIVGGAVLVLLFSLGWVGVERMFFLHVRDGQKVTFRDLAASVPFFIGRFFRLGLLVAIGLLPMLLVVKHYAGSPHASPAARLIQLLTVTVPLDIVLTFVPSALVYTTRSAWQALRIGLSMIRKTWPRSALYVLCPPLALNMLNTVYPTHVPVVGVVVTAVLALLALVAKGATAAFYLRVGSVSPETIADIG